MTNGLTEDTREVFHHFSNYKLSQSNAMKLSRMKPGKQKTAAILLASGQIRSLDEYQPVEVRAAPGHAKSSRQQKVEVLPALSQEHLHTLIGLTDSCRKTSEDYLSFVKEARANV